MADVVVVGSDDTETEHETVTEPEAESADEVGSAVADAVADTAEAVATSVASAVAETDRSDTIEDNRIEGLQQQVATLCAQMETLLHRTDEPEPEPEPAPVVEDVVVDDEAEDTIVPQRRHPWFRSLSEWKDR